MREGSEEFYLASFRTYVTRLLRNVIDSIPRALSTFEFKLSSIGHLTNYDHDDEYTAYLRCVKANVITRPVSCHLISDGGAASKDR